MIKSKQYQDFEHKYLFKQTCKHDSHSKRSGHGRATVIITVTKLDGQVGHRLRT